MDLGRPVARHLIRRPPEAIDLEVDVTPEEPAEPIAEDQRLRSETPER
jgi:hypothetical protein